MSLQRCNWPKLDCSILYQQYHDHEWGKPNYDDAYLFEMLVLESFHCGLSWLLILQKREAFKIAFDSFNATIIKEYNTDKIEQLLQNKDIVRHRGKIHATIHNAACFLAVQKEFGSFSNYIWSFTNGQVLHEQTLRTTNELSYQVSKDLKKRGFKFLGNVTTYSYLEAIGVMNNHQQGCFLYKDDPK